jgi:hypothetical protein
MRTGVASSGAAQDNAGHLSGTNLGLFSLARVHRPYLMQISFGRNLFHALLRTFLAVL